MVGDIAAVIAKVRSRQLRITENHPTLAQETREMLDVNLSVGEAVQLADEVERLYREKP